MSQALRTWREDLAGVGAIAAMLAGAWVLVVEPGSDAREQASALRIQTDLVSSQVAMVQAQCRAAEGDLADALERLGPSHDLRPPSDFNRLLAQLNQAAVDSRLLLDQITPGQVERLPEVTRHRISISGRGSYPGAVALLDALRDRFPDVTVLALSASRTGGDTGPQATVSLELAWHAQPDPFSASKPQDAGTTPP